MHRRGAGDTHGDGDDIYFNPFAGSSQSSFSSAVKPKDGGIGVRPVFRRRGSESAARRTRNDHDPWQVASSGSGTVHARSRTTDSVVGSSPKHHPLAAHSSGSGANLSHSSLVDTRPRLNRLLNDFVPARSHTDDSVDTDGDGAPRPAALKEKVVIVHEVSPKDSLAGVALKYGISMADLRRANQMWTSDPIHLRKTLYIPLDKSQKAKELVLSQLESNVNDDASNLNLLQAVTTSDEVDDRTPTTSTAKSLTIRRVPLSRLAYFPSSTSNAFTPIDDTRSARTLPRTFDTVSERERVPFESTPSSSSVHSASTSSSLPPTTAFVSALQAPPNPLPLRAPIPTLSSIFNAFPLARISFDSGTSTPSQASEDQEHEMNDVSRSSPSRDGRQRHRVRQPDYFTAIGSPPPPRGSAVLDGLELSPFSFSRGLVSPSTHRETPHSKATGLYTSPEPVSSVSEAVRTSQLQPTPVMQIPLKPRRDA